MIPDDLPRLLDKLERASHLAKFGNRLRGFGTQAERVQKRDAAWAAVECHIIKRRIEETVESYLSRI